MKNVLLASSLVGSLLAGSAAMAADLPVKAAPPPVSVVARNWTGCYVGAGIGYGFLNQRREVIAPTDIFLVGPNITILATASDPLFPRENFGGDGFLGTAQVGCDYQFAGNWVIGAFIDGDWTNIRGDQSLFHSFSGEARLRWSWAVGGRIGWLVTPTLLTYFTGGYTQAQFSEVDFVNSSTLALVSGPLVIAAQPGATFQRAAQRYSGWFIGGGTEYALSWWPGLFWKNEYRFADYGSKITTLTCVSCTAAVGPDLAERIHPYVHTVRTELVWRF